MQRSGSASRRTAAGAVAAKLTMIIATLAVFAVPLPARAQPRCAQPAAFVQTIVAQVEVVLASTGAPVRATRNMPVCAGEIVQVAPRSRAQVYIIASNSRLMLEENSRLEIGPANAPQPSVTLLRGALLFITRLRRAFEVRTPFVNASVEGTEFVVRVGANETTVTVLEGTVRAANDLGNVLVGAGQQAVAVKGQAPQLQVVVRPRDAVQWAVYYEPVMPADTFEALDAVAAVNQNAAFFVRRAALSLSVGQLEAARADLDQAQKLDANYGDAYALRAITAVALNDKAQALENGRRAVERSPNSTAARLALSYALQSNFQLEEARDVVAQAVTSDANNAAAWARLAELRLMLDDVGGAAEAADRAVKLAPESGRPRVVLGFVQLAQLKVGDAERTFEQALDLQSSDPLAHFGHGLAQIRRGRLEAGRGDLETAVALSPENAILRSYLGKAYFDEKRDTLAGEQFASAKALDPLDPTAYYYDAIRLQTINRPVEALADVQQAIQLNDNRAVYRSSFLLDEDLAARQAGLARLYLDLGFEERALLEGWKSVQADDIDHSGHRFLSDTYSALPRHEVARVSELLQAQLLQPISLTPVPPRLAQTDLFILEGTGPDRQAFNEFNPLFNRNRLAIQVSGAAGQNSVLGNEATVSGVWDRLSFSVGQFHYDTDGFRVNNGQDLDLQNAFVQTQLSSSTSVQAEVRVENRRYGDLSLLFRPDDFSAALTRRDERVVARIGGRHAFSPRSVVILSVYRSSQEREFTESTATAAATTASRSFLETTSWTGEVRHLFREQWLSMSSGLGRFQSEDRQDDFLNIRLARPPFTQLVNRATTTDDNPHHTYVYVYPSFDIGNTLTVTAGVSADFYAQRLFERDQVNPKLGLSWMPLPSTYIRLGTIRTLHRSLVTRQTIEPTQVAGFNQWFEDQPGTDARRHGLAVDQQIGGNLSAGAEYSWRTLRVPVATTSGSTTRVDRFTSREQLGRAYASWIPFNRASVGIGYLFERFDRPRDILSAEHFYKLRTHRVPLDLRYFAKEGVFAQLAVTRLFQKGLFPALSATSAPPFSGEDRFWVVDASIGFRIPRRIGRFAVEMKNLFDEDFRFQDTDPANPTVRPGRLVVFSFTVGT